MTASDRPDRVDVLAYRDGAVHRAVEAGRGQAVVSAHESELRRRRLLKMLFGAVVAVVLVGYGVLTGQRLLGGVAALIVAAGFYVGARRGEDPVPEVVERNIDRERAERRYDLASVTADPTSGA